LEFSGNSKIAENLNGIKQVVLQNAPADLTIISTVHASTSKTPEQNAAPDALAGQLPVKKVDFFSLS
jgi:hypothetical protein